MNEKNEHPRQAAVEGDSATSAEYLGAMVRMGSHAAQEPILIGSLVGIVERPGIHHCQHLLATTLHREESIPDHLNLLFRFA